MQKRCSGSWLENISQNGKQNGSVQRGSLTDRLLSGYPHMLKSFSAISDLKELSRDEGFAIDFLSRHFRKLLRRSNCFGQDRKGQTYPPGYCITQYSLKPLKSISPNPRF